MLGFTVEINTYAMYLFAECPIFMQIFNRLFKSRKNIDNLANILSLPVTELAKWESGNPLSFPYKTFSIPKKKPGEYRQIHAPSKELKQLQRKVYQRILRPLNLHPSATGFVPQKSIVHNALPHRLQAAVINLDLKDFFPSISLDKIVYLWHQLNWDEQTTKILTHICCHNYSLPQGAPTSPILSNLVNRKFDIRLYNLANRFYGTYTRYADDITLSFPQFGANEKYCLKQCFQIIREEGYTIQKKKKIRIQRAHHRQTATGLIVNQHVNLPRETRKLIRAMQHYQSKGKLASKDQKTLTGYESLLKMIAAQSKDQPIKPKILYHEKMSLPANTTFKFSSSSILTIIILIIAIILSLHQIYPFLLNPRTSTNSPSTTTYALDINAIIAQTPPQVPSKLNQYQRWAIALGAVLTEQNYLPHDQISLSYSSGEDNETKQLAQLVLQQSYDTSNKAEVLDTLFWLANVGHSYEYDLPDRLLRAEKSDTKVTNQSVKAWDYGRFVFVARAAYTAGYISEAEALALIENIGYETKLRFSSWQEFADNYVIGRSFWQPSNPNIPQETRAVIDRLTKPPGTWTQIPWEWSTSKD